MDGNTEEWRDIEGYPKYQVSNIGNIKSFQINKSGRLRKLKTDKDGYKAVELTGYNKKVKFFRVHRLVGFAFIPNPHNLPKMNHKNGIKDDNRVSNLEWCDDSYNNHYRHVLNPDLLKGEGCPTSKLTNEQVIEINNLAVEGNLTYRKIAEKYGVCKGTIDQIMRRKQWTIVTSDLPKREPPKRLNEKEILEVYNLAWNSELTQKEIADMYNIVRHTVCAIKIGKSHSDVTKHVFNADKKYHKKLTENEVIEIYNLSHCDSAKADEIAKTYNISTGLVYGIKNGHNWSNVTKHKYIRNPTYGKKVTKHKAIEIYDLAVNKKMRIKDIAEIYNIRTGLVQHIKKGHAWRSVTHQSENEI